MFHITIIQPDGSAAGKSQKAVPSLEQLKAGVGGYLEVVPHWTEYNGKPCVVFCNEEGKLEGLEENNTAQMLWQAEQMALFGELTDDYLVGPIVIVTADSHDELGQL